MDKVLITGQTIAEYWVTFEKVLQRLKDYGFSIGRNKTELLPENFRWLGIYVSTKKLIESLGGMNMLTQKFKMYSYANQKVI